MATVQRYVHTGSTAGGDGTTNATSGSSRAYASLSEWEANSGGSATDDYIVDCQGSTADTTAVVVDFTTNITTGSITIRANTGEADGFYDGDAVISASHYRLTQSASFITLHLLEANTTVDGLQVQNGRVSTAATGITLGHPAQTVRRCRVHAIGASGYGIFGNLGSAHGATITIQNNLVVGFTTGQIGYTVAGAFTRTVNIDHNTLYGDGSSNGLTVASGTGVCTFNLRGNAIANSGSGTDIVASGIGGSTTVNYDDNATEQYDLGTTGEIALGTLTDAWTSPGTSTSSDFTVKDASSPLNFTVTGTLVSEDIRGTTRSNYSVGAFEFASVGGATSFEFTTPSFGFSSHVFGPRLSTTLTSQTVNITPQNLSPKLDTSFTSAVFNFTAQALNTGAESFFTLTQAVVNFTAQSFNFYKALIHELTTATFNFTGRALSYLTGVVTQVKKAGGMFMMLSRKLHRNYRDKIGKHE